MLKCTVQSHPTKNSQMLDVNEQWFSESNVNLVALSILKLQCPGYTSNQAIRNARDGARLWALQLKPAMKVLLFPGSTEERLGENPKAPFSSKQNGQEGSSIG